MKINLLFLVLVVLTGLTVFANDDHSANVCSDKDAKVCGHIGHMEGMKPNAESSFMAHLSVPKGSKVSDLKIVLWMPDMGHGSSPVVVSPMGANKYKVTKASFTMAGAWDVQMKFKIGAVEHQINVPLKIAE